MSEVAIRPVRGDDAAAIAAIYAPYVTDSVISFELEAPDAQTIRGRIEKVTAAYPWIVAMSGGRVAGYAYGGLYRERAAYRWTVETTVYVDMACARQGIGRALYAALLEELARRGFVTALGVIALPNAPSVALHEALGFTHAGTQAGVGYKFGGWHDIGIWQRDLAPRLPAPPEPARA
ncbi:MAG: acetyltransferase [Sphingomonas bacterium]|nr:GNAT family N-acetyltransferase [Sphingomonas bacterium]MDB5689613.1 acetyltransferase [Sphingomonas bacterium]